MEFSDTVAVICQNGHLQEIPDDVPLNCEVLIVSVNNITRIKRTDVNRFTQLSVLRASRNHLSHIDDEAFVNSQKLKILDLSHNKLTNLTELMFVGLNQLISLNLMANHISQIASNVFQHLSIIDRVVLDSNDIENLTEIATIFTLPNINSISLNNNHFTSINSDDLPFASSNVTFLSALSHRLNKFILKRNIFPNLGSLKLKTGIFTEWRVDSDAYLSSVIDLYLNKLSLASFSAILNSTVSLQNLTLSGLDQQTMKLFTQVACSTTSITTLALTFSPLHFTDDEFFTSCSQLHNLKMPSSFLSDMSDQSLKPLTQLRLLQLDVNNLVKVPVTVVGGAQYQCVSPLTQTLHRFLDFDIRQCSINVELILFTSSFSVTLLTLIMAFIFHFLRFQLAYAYYLFLAHLYDTKKQRKRDPAHRYDAFVSYNVHDEEWVYRELLPVLEGEQGWKLCLHHRDFQPGKPIVENITDAIYSSRKTLCVISRHYLQSEWCSREIQMASVRLFDEHKDVLLLVFLEDLPPWHLSPYYQMRRLMKKRSYLSWPRAAQSKDLFWHKLRQALETDINADDQRHQILQPQD
ncbi:hypothetical protein WMY93_014193 [Mugilogobius chulae]|uniref:TIR domain-containing protein n=1 Tax=Mugilogobius chulae TaxID=88201 RepID=A0AAW0NUW5_9GOBI